jgi:hypothetical protein
MIITDDIIDEWLDQADENKIITALKIYRNAYHQALDLLKKAEMMDMDRSITTLQEVERASPEVEDINDILLEEVH